MISPGLVIQASLFTCDISFVYSFINIIESGGSGEQLKATFFSHRLWYLWRGFSSPTRNEGVGHNCANWFHQIQDLWPLSHGHICNLPEVTCPATYVRFTCPIRVATGLWLWGLGCNAPLAGSHLSLQVFVLQEAQVTATGKFSGCWLMRIFWHGHKEGKVYSSLLV